MLFLQLKVVLWSVRIMGAITAVLRRLVAEESGESGEFRHDQASLGIVVYR